MTPEQAEKVALEALAHIVANEELCPVFMGATGVSVQDLRERASDPVFLGAVLAFLTMDDAWVVSFCDGAGYPYETPLQAQHALPGGEQVNWT